MKSKRMQSAEKFIQHFADNDNEVLHSLLADNLAYTFSPVRSVDNVRPFDKAGYLDFKELLKTVMTGYPPMEVVQYIDSESSNMVVVWATGKPQFREEAKDYEVFSKKQWDYVGEFVFMLSMDETGEKIKRIDEFVDTKGTELKLWPLAMRALDNMGKRRLASEGA